MIDDKNRQILSELDRDSRISVKKIAEKLNMKKETVNYRLNNLISSEIISRFFSEIDFSKLGRAGYKVYLQFQNLTKKIEEEIWNYLLNSAKVVWVVRCSGRWDAIIGFAVKDLLEFNKAFSNFMNKYSRYVQNKQIVMNIKYYLYNRKWLLDKPEIIVNEFSDSRKKSELDKKDLIILKELSGNSRIPVVNLAQKTHLSAPQVLYRIKNLKKKEILVSNKIDLDLEKFGYQFCKTFVYMKNFSIKRKNQFLEFCKSQKNITALSEVIAPWDIELEFEVENFNKMMKIIDLIRDKFSDIFRSFESVVIVKESGRIQVPKYML